MAKRGAPKAAAIPQSRNPVGRASDGTVVEGTGSLNPGGVPKWRREFAAAFGERCAPLAEQVLYNVLSGAEEGAKVSDKVSAADVVLKYIIPKPTQQHDVSVVDKRDAFAGLSAEQLVELAKQKPPEAG